MAGRPRVGHRRTRRRAVGALRRPQGLPRAQLARRSPEDGPGAPRRPPDPARAKPAATCAGRSCACRASGSTGSCRCRGSRTARCDSSCPGDHRLRVHVRLAAGARRAGIVFTYRTEEGLVAETTIEGLAAGQHERPEQDDRGAEPRHGRGDRLGAGAQPGRRGSGGRAGARGAARVERPRLRRPRQGPPARAEVGHRQRRPHRAHDREPRTARPTRTPSSPR